MTQAKNYYSKTELAQKLGVSIRTVDNWMSVGKISFTKVGRRVIFSEDDLQQLIEFNRNEAFYYQNNTGGFKDEIFFNQIKKQ